MRGLRAITLGTLLVFALTALTLYSNLRFGRYITAASLPGGAVFMFVVALVGNALWGRVAGAKRALTLPELAIIFSMLYISAALPQASVGETLVSLGAAPAYFPKGSPRSSLFDEKFAPWLLVQDPEAIRRFYEGYGPAGGPVPWSAWIPPLLGWSVFVFLLLYALHCLSRAFIHRWVREERVSFPLMDLPLELVGQSPAGLGGTIGEKHVPLWRNPLMWVGAAIPATMIAIGHFHKYYPWIPEWQQIISYKPGTDWNAPPLSALKEFTISIWPLVIGIAYLLNAEIGFSIWAFHLLFWAQMYLFALLGHTPEQAQAAGGGGFNPLDWIHFTEFGGAIALSALLLATVRKDAARAARALLSREKGEDLPVPPWAVGGFVLANAGMLLWAWLAGASPLVVGVFLLFLYAIVSALSRMVAAGGLYLVDNGYEPQAMLYGFAGVRSIDLGSHYVLTGQESLFGRADMSYLYFAVNEGRFAHDTRTENRWHGAAIIVSVTLALVAAYILILLWSYRYGAVTFKAWPFSWRSQQVFDRTNTFLNAISRGPDAWTYAGTLTGIGIATMLAFLNRTFLWWRLSPFGFVVASSWNIAYQIWSSVFFGWLIASLIRRYGGLTLYRSLRPFFLGLILGDAVTFNLVVCFEIWLAHATGAM